MSEEFLIHPKLYRKFPSGATRDTDEGKLDYEAFFSYPVLHRYAEYMHKHRRLPDGSLRDGDNWQSGFPLPATMKSLWRHFMEMWGIHRGYGGEADMEEALVAVIFNASSYLHEVLKNKSKEDACKRNLSSEKSSGD